MNSLRPPTQTTELDYGVANVTRALQASGQWANTVLLFVSDNGGPLDHSSNFPHRGGKASEWEGGVRVVAFVHSPLFPQKVRGSTWSGMAHSSDWWLTCVIGIAGGVIPPAVRRASPRPTDGFNLWPALTGLNLTSPRTEVIHAVQNKYFNNTAGHCPTCKPNVGISAARFGDYKIILDFDCDLPSGPSPAGVKPAGNEIVSWPTPGTEATPFGLTTGWVREGTNWAYSGLLPSKAAAAGGADPTCATGLVRKRSAPPYAGVVCEPKSQSGCTCAGGKPVPASPPTNTSECVKEECCIEDIIKAGQKCSTHDPPCVLPGTPTGKRECLFNLVDDPSESKNLRNDPTKATLWKELVEMLQVRRKI